MKKLLIILAIFLMTTLAQAATLQFDPAENADGYLVYYAQGAEQFSNDIGDRTIVDLSEFNLTPGTWVFYVTAYNVVGESGSSNTADYTVLEYTPTDNPKPVTIIIPGPVTIIVN